MPHFNEKCMGAAVKAVMRAGDSPTDMAVDAIAAYFDALGARLLPELLDALGEGLRRVGISGPVIITLEAEDGRKIYSYLAKDKDFGKFTQYRLLPDRSHQLTVAGFAFRWPAGDNLRAKRGR